MERIPSGYRFHLFSCYWVGKGAKKWDQNSKKRSQFAVGKSEKDDRFTNSV